ncbi:hypothetical protein EJ06DRAFT_227926 [Trichodelitschia bisporula]|uniref:Uncharacterized protein n=1 Tax=Trichodelitschia bisporula TaxID=703511 RepID=A0A6G1HLC4_9PEZI|nr:hypothetical protein EJ06DRAFT_227926 [Trichodelitschia bisporula]
MEQNQPSPSSSTATPQPPRCPQGPVSWPTNSVMCPSTISKLHMRHTCRMNVAWLYRSSSQEAHRQLKRSNCHEQVVQGGSQLTLPQHSHWRHSPSPYVNPALPLSPSLPRHPRD